MRIENSIKNISFSLLSQIIIIFLGFMSRRVFLDSLGAEYLGVNGLLTNVLSMLSLAEGGIGVSITYNMYKPLAEGDNDKVISLVQLYKKLYGILAIIIIILSMILYPLLGKIMNGTEDVKYISIVYILFVIKSIISYLNAHKWSLITADQKGYVLTRINTIFMVITNISKIIVLKYTKNYIAFLVIELLIFIVQNIWNGKIVNTRYPYIKTKIKHNVSNDVKENLITNVKAIFLHNIGSYCVFGTDNILISAMINVKTVGLYSNYTMIINQLNSFLGTIISGIGDSVGNLIAEEDESKMFKVFKVSLLVNFWIYSLGTIFLFNLIEPFICWWLGEGLLLSKVTLIILMLNFYLTGMRKSISMFKSKGGIFYNDRFAPIIESLINLGTSIVLASKFGIVGIFLGTTISSICVPIWIQAKLVYNKLFNLSVYEYFKVYLKYFILNVGVCIITSKICSINIVVNAFGSLIYKGIVCICVPSLIYLLLFRNTNELKYLVNIANVNIVNKIKHNIKFGKSKVNS